MRHFICVFEMIRFGIPAESTERIIQLSRTQNSPCEIEDNDVFISLPAMFNKKQMTDAKQMTAPHGLLLKLHIPDGKKIILLSPKVEKDMEIPENKIHELPALLSGPFIYFKGVFFNEEKPVFIISPEKLLGYIK